MIELSPYGIQPSNIDRPKTYQTTWIVYESYKLCAIPKHTQTHWFIHNRQQQQQQSCRSESLALINSLDTSSNIYIHIHIQSCTFGAKQKQIASTQNKHMPTKPTEFITIYVINYSHNTCSGIASHISITYPREHIEPVRCSLVKWRRRRRRRRPNTVATLCICSEIPSHFLYRTATSRALARTAQPSQKEATTTFLRPTAAFVLRSRSRMRGAYLVWLVVALRVFIYYSSCVPCVHK